MSTPEPKEKDRSPPASPAVTAKAKDGKRSPSPSVGKELKIQVQKVPASPETGAKSKPVKPGNEHGAGPAPAGKPSGRLQGNDAKKPDESTSKPIEISFPFFKRSAEKSPKKVQNRESDTEEQETAPPLVLKKPTSAASRKNFFYRLMNMNLGKRKMRKVKPKAKPNKRVTIKPTPSVPQQGRRNVVPSKPNTSSYDAFASKEEKEPSKLKQTDSKIALSPTTSVSSVAQTKETNSKVELRKVPSLTAKQRCRRRLRRLRNRLKIFRTKPSSSTTSVRSKRSCKLWQKVSSKSLTLSAKFRRSKRTTTEPPRRRRPLRRRIKLFVSRSKKQIRAKVSNCCIKAWNASETCRLGIKACCRNPAVCFGGRTSSAIISACLLNIAAVLWIAPAIGTFLEFWDPYPFYYEHPLVSEKYPKGQHYWRFQFWQIIFAVTITASLSLLYFLATAGLLLGMLVDKKLLVRISLVLIAAVHVLGIIVAGYQNLLLCGWHKSCWEKYPGVVQPLGPCYYYFPTVAYYESISSWSCREWPYFSHFWIEFVWWWYPFWICCSYESYQTRRRKFIASCDRMKAEACASCSASVIFAHQQSGSQTPKTFVEVGNEVVKPPTPSASKPLVPTSSQVQIDQTNLKPG